jgi:hypothetical protein
VAITHFLLCALHLRAGAVDAALGACNRSHVLRAALYESDPQNSQLLRGMALINRRLADVLDAKGDRGSALRHLTTSSAFYDTLMARGAANRNDSSDARAVRDALRGRIEKR